MKLEAPFFLREQYNQSLLDLLQKTTLGTNGAKYQHLNTSEIIKDLDNPLFLSLERNEKTIGNIAFCRRDENWYIRYFAFEKLFQSTKTSKNQKKSKLKDTLGSFFDSHSEEGKTFYAYVEPTNIRSKQMCLNFGFQVVGALKTYSFSRKNSKLNSNLEELTEDKSNYISSFSEDLFFTAFQPKRSKIYVLKNEIGEEIASARIQHAHWRIERLPGKMGTFLVKILPYIPIINQFLNPNNYRFLVPDCVKAKSSEALETLFESILAQEHSKLLLWWIDEKDALNRLDKNIKWGVFKRFLGNPKVEVLAKFSESNSPVTSKTFFVNGIDLI
ncbi:MAG: hypothetical protein ACK5B9_10560 [Flavobacteriia bacterium]|jgi:hypothetical protein